MMLIETLKVYCYLQQDNFLSRFILDRLQQTSCNCSCNCSSVQQFDTLRFLIPQPGLLSDCLSTMCNEVSIINMSHCVWPDVCPTKVSPTEIYQAPALQIVTRCSLCGPQFFKLVIIVFSSRYKQPGRRDSTAQNSIYMIKSLHSYV